VPVSADTALRLGHYFGTGPEFWMNLQAGFDIAVAQAKLTDLATIEPLHAA